MACAGNWPSLQQISAVVSASKNAYEQSNGLRCETVIAARRCVERLVGEDAAHANRRTDRHRRRCVDRPLRRVLRYAACQIGATKFQQDQWAGIGSAGDSWTLHQRSGTRAVFLYQDLLGSVQGFYCHVWRLAVVASKGGSGCWIQACRPRTGHRLRDRYCKFKCLLRATARSEIKRLIEKRFWTSRNVFGWWAV